MLLRRVIDHVRRQEWTAIAIDLVIVVLGVFIGMQVANWNEARADERLGRAYAARLAVDLEHDRATRGALVAYYGAVLESVERTDALLADAQAEPKDLVVAAYRASEINFLPSSSATWNEIVSSGDVGLLPPGVADKAAVYFAFDTAQDAYAVLSSSAYRRAVRTTIPLAMQKALRAGCSDVRDEAQQISGFMPGCNLDVDAETIAATAAALRADPAVRASLRYQYSDIYTAHANLKGDVVAIERALAALHGARPAANAAP
jgi:hypothetical protein